ncbi:hypothetical protein [uncultured Desulfosarcina sp.]|uniref:hypothetical protein n=1 Tax=uncultured Desulfosarcina sp. TaxID=218289 RepID=UPI0029C64C1F|nr:hypothetical protein [uncultured Desulfosarcina sp.]
MRYWFVFAFILIVYVLSPGDAFSGNDALYETCKDHPRGPWCYQEALEQRNQPELCEKILEYWPKADGVHGWCYYQLAMKNKDCSLCERIRTADIKNMCRKDVCN